MRLAPAGVPTEAHSTETNVNIFIEHDAAALVALGLTADPACDGVILKHGSPSEVLGSTCRGNPLAEASWLADVTAPGDRIVSWTGTLAEGLFESHPMTWLRPGREAFANFCLEIMPQLTASGKTVCFQPHCRHVLSDPQSCLNFHREQEGPFEFALSPGDMMEPVMIDDIEDHLTRSFEALGELCAMVILQDVVVEKANGAEPGSCHAAPLSQGDLPRSHVRQLIDACVPAGTPIVISAPDIESQLEWLGI